MLYIVVKIGELYPGPGAWRPGAEQERRQADHGLEPAGPGGGQARLPPLPLHHPRLHGHLHRQVHCQPGLSSVLMDVPTRRYNRMKIKQKSTLNIVYFTSQHS